MKKRKSTQPRAGESKKPILQEAAEKSVPTSKDPDSITPANQTVSFLHWTDPSITDADLTDEFLRLLKIVRKGVIDGNKSGIQIAVMAADAFAGEIERAHQMHLSTLREITEELPVLAVRISRKTLADKTDDRKNMIRWLEDAGLGTRATDATGRKIFSPDTNSGEAKRTVQRAIDDLQLAQSSSFVTKNKGVDSILKKWASEHAKILPLAKKLPPFSWDARALWWQAVRKVVEIYFSEDPSLIERIFEKNTAGFKRSGINTEMEFVLRLLRQAFGRLAKNQK